MTGVPAKAVESVQVGLGGYFWVAAGENMQKLAIQFISWPMAIQLATFRKKWKVASRGAPLPDVGKGRGGGGGGVARARRDAEGVDERAEASHRASHA
jgi:hypothetical protein